MLKAPINDGLKWQRDVFLTRESTYYREAVHGSQRKTVSSFTIVRRRKTAARVSNTVCRLNFNHGYTAKSLFRGSLATSDGQNGFLWSKPG